MLAVCEHGVADGDRRNDLSAVQFNADRFADARLEDLGGQSELAEQTSADRDSSAHFERCEENILVYVCVELLLGT